MKDLFQKYSWFLWLVFIVQSCVKPYEPPVLQAANNYLVVDGFINTTANGVTIITLSRTMNLQDTVTNISEPNASVSIQSSDGVTYPLYASANDGIYASQSLNLNNTKSYRLLIRTANGNEYQSELVPCKQTPPIDSITWQQEENLNIYVNTHDPANNTRYYKWDFVETWQYHAQLEAAWVEKNGFIYAADSTNQKYSCWANRNSTNILLGTSTALSEDVINKALLAEIIKDDEKLGIRYSMLLKQHALTQEAYQYWLIIQKNSQQLGGLFDLQPSQINGNIHALTNPTEPVIGFISASSEQQKRLFINNNELIEWNGASPGYACPLLTIDVNPVDFRIYTYSDVSFTPYYFSSGALIITKKTCVDCTLRGGVNQKPPFW